MTGIAAGPVIGGAAAKAGPIATRASAEMTNFNAFMLPPQANYPLTRPAIIRCRFAYSDNPTLPSRAVNESARTPTK